MINVAGKPCLEHIVEKLEAINVGEIIVKAHYKKEQVMDYFGERVLYLYQPELLEEEESLKQLETWLWDDVTVVINGDTLSDINIIKMAILSNGKNIRHVDSKDKEKYAGTKILSPEYWKGNNSFADYLSEEKWFDIGTFTGLKKAREYYERKNIDLLSN